MTLAYVPYHFWDEVDPKVTCCVQNTLRSFRHELLVSNFEKIPVLQQHGTADDNVPVFHSRRLRQLISPDALNLAETYHELQGKGHWFDGVMTTLGLRRFYEEILEDPVTPHLPWRFTIVVANAAHMGPRGGLQVDLLLSPDQLGSIQVDREPSAAKWRLITSNIQRFHFVSGPFSDDLPEGLVIDSQQMPHISKGQMISQTFGIDAQNVWHGQPLDASGTHQARQSSQLGPLSSILRSSGHFIINVQTPFTECTNVASQVSRNHFQYFQADTEILVDGTSLGEFEGNVIAIALGVDLEHIHQEKRPVRVSRQQILIDCHNDNIRKYDLEEGLGAIFLSPLPKGRLELVVWGFDVNGLRQAARLVPMLTGVGQPEFIIVRKRCAWEGAAGVLAMGALTNTWQASAGSFMI